MITVFTPTYNRAYILPKLYESLCHQTCKDFEWLIVDDGSTDETEEVVNNMIFKTKLNIRYLKKENGGLNSAYNFAVENTENEIFFRVDSDDSIKENAIQLIYDKWILVKNNEKLSGLVFLSVFNDGKVVGRHPFTKDVVSNFFDYRYKYRAVGDRAEVVKTSVLKNYPFPLLKNEKFIPEGLMWNRIAKEYDAIYINEPIYIRDYLEDSITSKVVQTLKKNCKGATLYYSELLKCKQPFLFFVKHSLLYWRYAFYKRISLKEKIKESGFSAFFIGFIPAFFILAIDKLKGRTI